MCHLCAFVLSSLLALSPWPLCLPLPCSRSVTFWTSCISVSINAVLRTIPISSLLHLDAQSIFYTAEPSHLQRKVGQKPSAMLWDWDPLLRNISVLMWCLILGTFATWFAMLLCTFAITTHLVASDIGGNWEILEDVQTMKITVRRTLFIKAMWNFKILGLTKQTEYVMTCGVNFLVGQVTQ